MLEAATGAVCKVNGEIVACPDFGPFVMIAGLLAIVFGAIFIAANWKIYSKAGKPGWTSLIPIYNIVVLLEIVGKPIWWIVLFLVPFVNVIMGFIVAHELAKSFGKGIGFTLGFIFLPIIFYPILGFGKAQYVRNTPAQGAVV